MSSFYKLAIKEITRETPHTISVLFNVPLEFQDFYKFTAGQYVNLKLTLDGQELRRAYSICSAPSSGELRIAIKAVKNGNFSKFANEQLTVGNVIEVGLPEGKFTFEPNSERQRNYMAFAAGSGITPIMSIIQSVLKGEPQSTFVLVYGNKSAEETIFHNQLIELQQKYLGRFFIHFVYSQSNAPEAFFGRVDKSVVNNVLNSKHIGKEFSKFYLCGPEEMINIVSSTLKEKNIPESAIKFELFSASPTENKVDLSAADHSKITVIVDADETTFEMSAKQTLLEAALKQGLDAPYSCQGGVCSSCIARVTQGTAVMKKNSILTDKEIAEGLVLTCQAHPTTTEIVVDYDDV
ncbi:ferredoxin--NADP reductase [Flavobacterium amniphilum]|uniref:ferredoxin--NADP reductase n=1 Tax=Flavobacterium amniphilum TaxID=1834035 RepID=UPI00202A59B5|nr:ferredoxin--NADP reductase [Flavobacterium amniphilum]MCL9804084.1 ferredoxin--NADP reductase [Flavobacterium amniphilum]